MRTSIDSVRDACVIGLVCFALCGCGGQKAPEPSTATAPSAAPEQAAPVVPAGLTEPAPETAPAEPVASTAFAALLEAQRKGSPRQWDEAEAKLIEFGPAAIPVLTAAAESGERDERELATTMLAVLGGGSIEATKALAGRLNDESNYVRANAVSALCHEADYADAVTAAAIELLQTNDDGIQQVAAVAIGQIGTQAEAAVPELTRLAREGSGDLQLKAIVSLGQIGPAAVSAADALKALCESQDESLSTAARESLDQIIPKTADSN